MKERPDDPVVLCRCEDVTLEQVRELLRAGYRSLEEIKRFTRCGMGLCQGRNCLPLVASEIARHAGTSPEDIPLATHRPPAAPVPLGELARLEEET